jgi:hypothetical protein
VIHCYETYAFYGSINDVNTAAGVGRKAAFLPVRIRDMHLDGHMEVFSVLDCIDIGAQPFIVPSLILIGLGGSNYGGAF